MVAAFALSSANAGPCKPSSSITTTTAGITSDTTSETTASKTTTSVASTTTTETSVSTTETSLSSTESSESTSKTTSGTTTIEITTTTSTTASESATTTAGSCTLTNNLYIIGNEVCGRHGTLGILPDDSHVETGLTLEECATKANAYSGFSGQTGGMSFIFNTDGVCNIFAGRADDTDYDASVFAVVDSGTDLQYNINCFDCPDNNPIREFPRCVIQQQAPDRRRVAQLVCGVAGSISGTAEPYQVYDDLDRNAIAEQCAEKCYDDSNNCETFVVVDGSSCKLYHQATSVLNFVADEESTLAFYDRSCASCGPDTERR
ncbi:hypothetical protein FALBO_5416 [Fusarium albosuccineum]|uniref:Apple domain-containing protein n=1 Tax=Fusarium albosuccineum TaxID=1237068 RepID=A0A8H4P9U6_9HYPO|nr:hypothetical protein FALBO_5416 [Fusarium albosuccineum]